MSEPLFVDTTRLHDAGAALQSLGLPQPPPPVTATGADPVAAAINATMPAIESPVVHGLPTAETAVRHTASKVITAAATYAESDQRLGEKLSRHQFTGGSPEAPSASPMPSAAAAKSIWVTSSWANDPLGTADDIVSVPAATTGPSQYATLATTLSGTAQSVVQTVQGAVGNVSAGDQPDHPDEGTPGQEQTTSGVPLSDSAVASPSRQQIGTS